MCFCWKIFFISYTHKYYDYAFYIDCSIERIHKIIHTYCDCIGNALDYHNNMKFTTWDQDNDRNSSNCAIDWRSAGWFNSCFHTNLNGQYIPYKTHGVKYMNWHLWTGSPISLKTMQLMIRPRA